MKVDFYQLSARPAEQVLPRLAEKIITEGGRLLVIAGAPSLLDRMDRALWAYRDDSFLPHAIAGRDVDAEQPILLAETLELPVANDAGNIALVDGLWREEALGFERAFYMFDDETVEGARATWRSLAGRDELERRFWRQDEAGKWNRIA